MTKKFNLRGIKGDGFFPPQNCHFAPSFIIFKKKFKKIQIEYAGHHESTFKRWIDYICRKDSDLAAKTWHAIVFWKKTQSVKWYDLS